MKTLAEHNDERRDAYNQPIGGPRKNGIACPKCGDELWDTNPAMTLTVNPPQKNIHCECGFRGHRLA